MLQRIEELLDRNETFSIETTLATKSYINLVHKAQTKGYRVHLIYFCLEEARKWVSLLHQKQGNKSIREFHGIQETRVAINETAIRMKENLGHRSRRLPHPWREGAQKEVSFFSILLLLLAAPHGLWDLRSPTRDGTSALCIESAES